MVLVMLGMAFDLFRACFEKTLKQTNTSMKSAALTMGIDPAQLRRELDGNGHLSARRVFDSMSQEFLQVLSFNLVLGVGLPLEIQTATAIQSQMEKAS